MREDGLSEAADDAYPACPACGTGLDDSGWSSVRARLRCPSCGLDVVAGY